MATKPENITTLTILLELDKADAKDLANLKPQTLENMVSSYIENAKRSNIKQIDEHINTGLPVVGPKILVFFEDKWVLCKRKEFINSNSVTVEFETLNGKVFELRRTNIKWKMP